MAEVLDLVGKLFKTNFGELHPFDFATDRKQALAVLDHFIAHSLPRFGDYQDAMVAGEPWLWHAVISPYLNVGLLHPMEVCRRAEYAWQNGTAPLNAVEGFIRQIIGWREYVRGIYFLEGPDYTSRNLLGHRRPLPAFFWGGETHMSCVSEVVGQTKDYAYAHHIQRLMVTGSFALLAGLDPAAVHRMVSVRLRRCIRMGRSAQYNWDEPVCRRRGSCIQAIRFIRQLYIQDVELLYGLSL